MRVVYQMKGHKEYITNIKLLREKLFQLFYKQLGYKWFYCLGNSF